MSLLSLNIHMTISTTIMVISNATYMGLVNNSLNSPSLNDCVKFLVKLSISIIGFCFGI